MSPVNRRSRKATPYTPSTITPTEHWAARNEASRARGPAMQVTAREPSPAQRRAKRRIRAHPPDATWGGRHVQIICYGANFR